MLTGLIAPTSANGETGISVPDGFAVALFANDDLAHDIHSLTFNAAGQVVVSGPGYVRTLIDADGDGKADSAREFAAAPETGAQGMCFLGPHLVCSGDAGLQMFRDDNRDGKADGPPEVFLRIQAGSEHNVHAIRKGPDGWWYVIAGNMAGVSNAYATLPTSPVKNPQAGTLLRLRPDLTGGEILADGFRNAYDFAFSNTGDIFTFDSDGERDISLPWYQPTRVLQVTPRSHAGWISRSWKRPDHFADMPPVLGRFGRGSPSGVVCYRHTRFPYEYQGAIFALDWTYGRILAMPLRQNGSVWASEPIDFAGGTGQFGFAPTDIEVSADGSLFVSVGGRGTRGGIYRISWEGDRKDTTKDDLSSDEQLTQLTEVLQSPQSESSWSRAFWVPRAKELGKATLLEAAMNEDLTVDDRIRAVEILTELFGGIDEVSAERLADAAAPALRARVIWSTGRTQSENLPLQLIRRYLNDSDPLVVRSALETLTTATDSTDFTVCLEDIAAATNSTDRFVRAAVSALIPKLDEREWNKLILLIDRNRTARVTAELGRQSRPTNVSVESIGVSLEVFSDTGCSVRQRLDAARLMQLALGDVGPRRERPAVFDSCASQPDLSNLDLMLNSARTDLARLFPTSDDVLNGEILRLIGMLAPPNRDLIPKILHGITAGTNPTDDIHRLIVLSRIPVEKTYDESMAVAAALVNLDVKIRARGMNQDSNWDDRIGELYRALCEADPVIPDLIVDQPGFGLPGHVLLLSEVKPDKMPTAVEHFVRTAARWHLQGDDFDWSNDVIFAIGESSKPEHRDVVRKLFDNLAVRGAVVMVLAESADPTDRHIFVAGIGSAQLNVVRAALEALKNLPPGSSAEEQFALLAAARRLINSEDEFETRESAVRLLQHNASQGFGFVFGTDGHRPQPEALQKWGDWLRQRYPDYLPKGFDSATADQLDMLANVDWDAGDPRRGEQLYRRLSCVKCHGGRKALGPDLAGVGRRFSTQDLFAAIIEPGRDVSSRYQTTSVITSDGQVFSGLIVYESADGLLLRDAEHRTWRIEGSDIETRLKQPNSLMPAGLLKDQSAQEFADLNAWLQQL